MNAVKEFVMGNIVFQVPPGTPKRIRVSLAVIQMLQYHSKLDGLMSFAGIWWGLLTILFPGFWYGWPVTEQLAKMTAGFPGMISWALLISGLASYACTRYGWKSARVFCSLLGFVCWCMLTTAFMLVKPVFSPAVACYSLFALAKLLTYVNNVIRIEEHGLPKAGEGDA